MFEVPEMPSSSISFGSRHKSSGVSFSVCLLQKKYPWLRYVFGLGRKCSMSSKINFNRSSAKFCFSAFVIFHPICHLKLSWTSDFFGSTVLCHVIFMVCFCVFLFVWSFCVSSESIQSLVRGKRSFALLPFSSKLGTLFLVVMPDA